MKYFPYLALINLLIFSCSEPSQYDVIKNSLKDSNIILNNYNSILVLSENGCIACNKKYTNAITSYSKNDSVLIFVTTKGTLFDISNLDNYHTLNVSKAYELFGTENSIALFINNSRIDTIIELSDAKKIDSQIDYISNKMKST